LALVLCTGVDQLLMLTRKLILEREGHTVVTAKGELELTAACEKHRFDVAVIGQAVSAKSKKTTASFIRRQCPSAKILELHSPYQGKTLDDADDWLEVPVLVPHDLAEHVTELAAKTKPGSA